MDAFKMELKQRKVMILHCLKHRLHLANNIIMQLLTRDHKKESYNIEMISVDTMG
jgi:hypothetical protein